MPVPLPRILGTPVNPRKPSVFEKVIDEYKKCWKGIAGYILIVIMVVLIMIGPITAYTISSHVCSDRTVILTISLVSLLVWILLIAPIIRRIGNWMDDNL